MQPRTLDQINASLGSIYDPQVQSAQQSLATLPNQQKADEAGLQAQQNQSFQDILNGARSRGTGVAFGGIPLQEQAQYTATQYLPALANLKSTYAQKTSSLQDAINQINQQRSQQAQNQYQYEQDAAEKKREFDASLALQRQQAAANSSFGNLFGNLFNSLMGHQQQGQAADPTQQQFGNGKTLQNAHDAVVQLMNTRNTPLIAQTYRAIQQAAAHGSDYDLAKLHLLQQLYGNSLAKNHIGAGQSDLVNLNMAHF